MMTKVMKLMTTYQDNITDQKPYIAQDITETSYSKPFSAIQVIGNFLIAAPIGFLSAVCNQEACI